MTSRLKYTMTETAKIVGVSVATIANLRRLGLIPAPKKDGRTRTYRAEVVSKMPAILDGRWQAGLDKRAQSMSRRWRQNPEQMSSALKRAWGEPDSELRHSRANSVKPTLSKEFLSQTTSDAAKKRWNDAEYREKHKQATKTNWSNPAYREKVIAAATHPDVRKKKSETMKVRMAEKKAELERLRALQPKEPRKRGGSVPGKLLSGSELKIAAIVRYKLQGRSDRWIQRHWKDVTGTHASEAAAKSFIIRHKALIAQGCAQIPRGV